MGSQFVPLVDVWPTHGLASVTLALLEDADFHPTMECDPRGWHHFRGWPLGSERPVTIWIPASECEEALTFLRAPFEMSSPSALEAKDFWSVLAANRKWVLAGWFLLLFFFAT